MGDLTITSVKGTTGLIAALSDNSNMFILEGTVGARYNLDNALLLGALATITPGINVATVLEATAGGTGSFALQNDPRLTGLGGPVTKNADWTFVATDIGKLYRCTDTGTHAWTIDTYANAPIAAGQTIVGTNESTATLTVAAPAGGSLIRLDGTAGTGTRTIGAASMFTLLKLDGANAWGISGTALS